MNRPQRNLDNLDNLVRQFYSYPAIFAFMAFALLGVVFAAFSSYDFIAHLDRQVHSITCSYIPGLESADVQGTSGCHTVLMSPYSSVLRTLT